MAFKMRESLDTNIILRLVMKDVPKQCIKIADMFMRQNVTYDVADLAVTEAVYVLQKKYTRGEIVDKLRQVLSLPDLNVNFTLFERVFPMYLEHPKLSFNDCCLAVYAQLNGAEPLWTFDRALAKEPGIKLVGADL